MILMVKVRRLVTLPRPLMAPPKPRLGRVTRTPPIFRNARTLNGFSHRTGKTLKSRFAPTLMPVTGAIRKAAPMFAPCGIGPRKKRPRWM
jgi:hypothetical protein